MASFGPMIRVNENAFRAPGKLQSKAGRKPLGDVTNSSKLPAKDKPNKASRKPLGDLTNSVKPRAKAKSSKKNCTENLCAVIEEQAHSWVLEEGFLHNHNECMRAQRKSMSMSMDYFLETVGLQRECSVPMTTPQLPQVSTNSKSEMKTIMEIDKLEIDKLEMSSPLAPKFMLSPKSPMSPCWNMEWKSLDFSPLKLKESPFTFRN